MKKKTTAVKKSAKKVTKKPVKKVVKKPATKKTVKKKTTKKSTAKKATTKNLVIVEQEEKIYDLQTELEAIKNPQGKLTLSKTPLQNNQLLTILQRTPQEHVHTRPGKGGGTFDYVTGVYVKKVLNYVFGWMWDFQVIDKGREDNFIWVHGRLSIKNANGETVVSKDQFGGAEIKFKKNSKQMLDYPNDLKGATTDALKKCASELGVASDIYGKNEFREQQPQQQAKKATPKNETTPTEVKDKQMQMLKAKLYQMGAKTELQAIRLFNKTTGIMWKDFNNKSPRQVQLGLAELLEALSK